MMIDGKPKSYTRVYNIWRGMRARCQIKTNPSYYAYGGRGIKVCDEWQKSDAFIDWAYKNGYKDNLTIDRIDPDGNYEPSNCRWISNKKNAKRSRKPYSLPYSDVKQSHKLWEHLVELGLSVDNFPEPKYPWDESCD